MSDYDTAIRMIDHKVTTAMDILSDFHDSFLTHPAYSFEWSSREFMAAARVEVGAQVLHSLNEGYETEILAVLRKKVLSGALHITSKSTSPLTNVMNECRLTASAEFLEILEALAATRVP